MTELEALAVRCEQASGPCRELDALVCAAAGFAVEYDRKHNDPEPYYEPVKDYSWQRVPAYTASLDAAMGLVSGRCTLISLSEIAADGLPEARVGRPDLDNVPIFTGTAFGVAMGTPITAQLALALTAASLRAIAGTSQEQEG